MFWYWFWGICSGTASGVYVLGLVLGYMIWYQFWSICSGTVSLESSSQHQALWLIRSSAGSPMATFHRQILGQKSRNSASCL
ncbi:hypothetical protein XENTR_v10004644 [Xenopus tropicalis]|nr:hypothetical protein XENTR_v10004644 [Xenopus tropicalis]